jgi:hypothetical protein
MILINKMGNKESIIINSNIGYANLKYGNNKVELMNGNIVINTDNIQKVTINNEQCIPCTELKKFYDSFKENECDEKIKKMYDTHCLKKN